MEEDREVSGSKNPEDEENPLANDSPGDWDRLVDAVGPASLLVLIEGSMSATLRRHYTAEDVLQEALLHAWRDRAKCEWRGLAAFRRWLLSVIDNRIHDLADRVTALKRGAGRAPLDLHPPRSAGDSTCASQWAGPSVTTTPSRVAIAREQAEAMREALDALPEDLRSVVHLRLFEDLTMPEVAERLGIGVSAAAHRFRKGAGIYQRRLVSALATRRSRG